MRNEASPLIPPMSVSVDGNDPMAKDPRRQNGFFFVYGKMITVIPLLVTITGIMMILLVSEWSVPEEQQERQVSIFDRVYWDTVMDDWGEQQLKLNHLLQMSTKIQHQDSPRSSRSSEQQPDEMIYFNHSSAFAILRDDGTSTARDFYLYQQGWEHQISQTYCAVASSVAVMNSLRGHISLPRDESFLPCSWATQTDLMLNKCVQNSIAKPLNGRQYPSLFVGMGLDMAQQLLECQLKHQGYSVEAIHVDINSTTVDDIRDILLDALHDKHARVMINYDRPAMDQSGYGHFSPIGAYNHKKDLFLIMDVAKYKYPPVWSSPARILAGVGSVDNCAVVEYPDYPLEINDMPPQELARVLKCQPARRGLIIVRKNLL